MIYHYYYNKKIIKVQSKYYSNCCINVNLLFLTEYSRFFLLANLHYAAILFYNNSIR
jgi:hypothetical protein